MAFRRRRRSAAETNVGPFSDIAFLLIIFFILTSTLTGLSGNKLDIPSVQESKKKPETEQPTVTLAGKQVLWGGGSQPITLDELRARLFELDLGQKPKGKRIVVINSSPDVDYQRYYEVMMAITEAEGILGMIAEPGQSAVED